MRLPGFTAEKSLGRSSKIYEAVATGMHPSGTGTVTPQRIKLRTIRCDCDAVTDICVCENGRVLSMTTGELY
jgi:hypothetical protein